eukprot:TRINITY_DN17856_c0_g1_i2.p1 TRINITY_DN17856_c0_g1~~TRINITY_DN17856_c0_g1_i2.p1  ORF type:complete len:832 (-),score=126.52 TRINITY_DN17856_c0_g1_i2:71-2566(-)
MTRREWTALREESTGPVPQDVGKQFDKIQEQLRDKVLNIDERCTFVFKRRLTTGRPIHIAAMHPKGSCLIADLVEKGSNVDERCIAYTDDGFKQELAPIHLAAGTGNTKAIEALIAKGSNSNLKTLSDGKEHYAALHDAAFFGVTASVSALIQAGADVDARNLFGQTPLHISVKSGSWRVSSLLVDNHADLAAEDNKKLTPLQTALVSAYPSRKMFILPRICMEDFMVVCQEDPGSARALFSTSSSGIDWGKKWRDGLTKPREGFSLPTIDDLVTLCEQAPRSLSHLLDQLSVQPAETDVYHKPIPKHASSKMKGFGDWELMKTTYTKQNYWQEEGYKKPEDDEGYGDKFRYQLCRCRETLGTQSSDVTSGEPGVMLDAAARGMSYIRQVGQVKKTERQLRSFKRVTMRILHLPNIVDIDFMDALSHVSGEEDKKALFTREAVRAMLDFVWGCYVRRSHNTNLFMLLIELSVFVWLAIKEPTDHVGMNAAWSLVAAFSYRMLAKEIGAIVGSWQNLGSPKYYFLNVYNWFEAGMAAVCLTNAHALFHVTDGQGVARLNEEQAGRALLAAASFIRWVKLMTSLSAYSFLGPQLLAITTSFFQIGGITTVLVFYFCAFAHTFAALRVTLNNSAKTIYEVALNSVKLLLTGDGDGINFVLQLGGRPEEGDQITLIVLTAAVFIFVLCVLNLFIAVHGEAYGKAAEMRQENFYAHRAAVCVRVMMQPSLKCCCSCDALIVYWMIMLPGFAIWAALVNVPANEMRYVAAAQLLVHLLCADAVLAKAPWKVHDKSSASRVSPESYTIDGSDAKADTADKYYLWWFTFVKAEESSADG